MNLPNSITTARMAIAPLIGYLPFVQSGSVRFIAFVLFIVAAVSDYWDGHLARKRGDITDLGRILDPLADKFLLVATFVPMAALMAPAESFMASIITSDDVGEFPFVVPFVGKVSLPFWVIAVVLAREALVTVLRNAASRRGHVIGAIGPAKWKTALQSMWVGAAFFWFAALSVATELDWLQNSVWQAFAYINGIFGVVSMVGAVFLTLYSLGVYIRRFRGVFAD